MNSIPYLVTIWLFVIGLYGIVRSRNLIHLVNCLTVIQSSTCLLLIMIGYRTNAAAPVFKNLPEDAKAVDPVVQALTLTDVVVGAVVIALLLAIAIQAHKQFNTLDPHKLSAMKG
ncbi:MAG TPA: sodium:proton antiporter [Ignavibacteriaceae bacterium]|nr:sodium:proton antiporter [Ignavibacteriaceae bacterium]